MIRLLLNADGQRNGSSPLLFWNSDKRTDMFSVQVPGREIWGRRIQNNSYTLQSHKDPRPSIVVSKVIQIFRQDLLDSKRERKRKRDRNIRNGTIPVAFHVPSTTTSSGFVVVVVVIVADVVGVNIVFNVGHQEPLPSRWCYPPERRGDLLLHNIFILASRKNLLYKPPIVQNTLRFERSGLQRTTPHCGKSL